MEATGTIHVDDGTFRITEWRIPPGASTGWHRHDHHYAVVPLCDGRLRIRTSDGWIEASLRIGVPYARQAGVEHDVHNGGASEIVFIEVERLDEPMEA